MGKAWYRVSRESKYNVGGAEACLKRRSSSNGVTTRTGRGGPSRAAVGAGHADRSAPRCQGGTGKGAPPRRLGKCVAAVRGQRAAPLRADPSSGAPAGGGSQEATDAVLRAAASAAARTACAARRAMEIGGTPPPRVSSSSSSSSSSQASQLMLGALLTAPSCPCECLELARHALPPNGGFSPRPVAPNEVTALPPNGGFSPRPVASNEVGSTAAPCADLSLEGPAQGSERVRPQNRPRGITASAWSLLTSGVGDDAFNARRRAAQTLRAGTFDASAVTIGGDTVRGSPTEEETLGKRTRQSSPPRDRAPCLANGVAPFRGKPWALRYIREHGAAGAAPPSSDVAAASPHPPGRAAAARQPHGGPDITRMD